MEDKDTANTMPGSGKINVLSEASSKDAQTFAHSTQQQTEGSKVLRRILVVEDDASLANLEADILTAQGYVVAIANNGEIAITALLQSMPDLVVLDLELPGTLTGWDVLQALRTHARIPVLLTTSLGTAVRKQIRTRGETRLTLDHLPKPYPMQTFLKRIKRMLTIAP